jgi:peptide/nickel transport system permease protein
VVRYIIRRLLWAIVLFLAITIVTYVIFYLVPTDPARLAAGRNPTPAQVKSVAHYLGTDRPVWYQYGLFLKRLVVDHSLGYSFADRVSVNSDVLNAAPVTASLVIGGAILWMLIAIPVGVFSALHPRSKTDRVAMASVLVGISAHPIWIGLILSYIFGYIPSSGHALGFSFPSFTFLPIQGYCNLRGGVPGAGVQRADPVVLPPDPALDHVRDPLRGVLRTHDPRERDGDPERGLRAHRAGEGRA